MKKPQLLQEAKEEILADILPKLIELIKSVDLNSKEAKQNKYSISDSNGNRIKL